MVDSRRDSKPNFEYITKTDELYQRRALNICSNKNKNQKIQW